ncbi:unnamed protein product [Euphydryas editha]|uniref:Reverse transcriptase domain-containing protein n=1 Tax=Euphydryas editha TaxID=104508 RepID=A0AAU9TWN1_EUPED|nr:unnamed protein product [Euphydryas editha]
MLKEADETTNQIRIESLSPSRASDYSLWKEFKKISRRVIPKPPIRIPDSNSWARTQQEKADLFATHLSKIFTPNDASPNANESDTDDILNQDFQLDLPIQSVTPQEIYRTIRTLKERKAPGFDLIDKKILKELPKKGIMYLTILLNSIIRLGYFPLLWKVSQIIMICKPGKPNHDVASYRPISLLPLLSKVFEKILLKKLLGVISERKILPDHQFGFRREHATIEQVHRVCQVIRRSLEQKEYCSSVFLDIKQALDKVWHKGLLYKVQMILPCTYFGIIKSYLASRIFQVRDGEYTSGFYNIQAGVPQGSVLGPVLYTLFTFDMPQGSEVTVATFADDTAILASNKDPVKASETLQKNLQETQRWMDKWRITASISKSLHITFTLRKGDCPPVKLGDAELPHTNCVRYLGMHLDRRLIWNQHIRAKREALNLKYRGLFWLLSRNSKLSIDNKLLIYKVALRPIWTYRLELWGSACDSNIKINQRAKDTILKQIANTPWFIKNNEIHQHLSIKTVKEEIQSSSTKYKSRLEHHPNQLAFQLTVSDCLNRLKKKNILNLDKP